MPHRTRMGMTALVIGWVHVLTLRSFSLSLKYFFAFLLNTLTYVWEYLIIGYIWIEWWKSTCILILNYTNTHMKAWVFYYCIYTITNGYFRCFKIKPHFIHSYVEDLSNYHQLRIKHLAHVNVNVHSALPHMKITKNKNKE